MTIEVYGSWGKLTCDDNTGIVIHYDRTNSDSETLLDGYYDITKVDVDRYRKDHGELPLSIDIIYIGFWHNEGYEEPNTSIFTS